MTIPGILELHQGCNGREGCFGPRDDFYTIFGGEVRLLTLPIFVALLIGVGTYFLLNMLRDQPIVSFIFAVIAMLFAIYVSVQFLGFGVVVY